ncbi:MAG TPA: autotransporter-associated beta strand repeat-containing protein [Verrucomicrobiae bacterium]
MKKLLFTIPLAISMLLAHQGNAQTLQWFDDNGASPVIDGLWDNSTANWATSATLTGSTGTFTNGNFAIFAAGSAAIPVLNINVPGAVSCEGIGNATTSGGTSSGARVETLNISGAGSISLPTGEWPMECGNYSSSDIIAIYVPIIGSGGLIQHNSGSLGLYGNNTYSGGTTATGGQIIYYNNNNSFGAGAITNSGGTSLWCTNDPNDIVTLANPFSLASGSTINFVNGDTICSGPWTLLGSLTLKNASAPTTNLTMSGTISGASGAGVTLGTVNGGTIILSGANTYSGPTTIALTSVAANVSVSSINSVTTPAQQASSSLGKPSSAANGTIAMGSTTFAAKLTYTGNGETSDRVINLAGTSGSATIEMDGAGPLVLTSAFTATGAGSKTLTLQGSSTAANTISGLIPNNSSANKTALTKAGTGSWTLSGKNTFTGNLAINAGTLTIGGSGDLGGGSYAGTIADAGTFVYDSSSGQTLSSTISGSGAFDMAGAAGTTVTISGTANTFTGLYTITAGTLAIDADGSLGTAPGTIVANDITLNGGPAANLRANANNITINANRGITLGATGGAIQVAGNDTCTYNGVISGSGPFQVGVNASTGLGVLVLGGSESYTNTTVIAAGTVRLSATGSIGNSAGILMSNSPTLDVSAQNPFELSTTNYFTAIGGSNTICTILGASGGDVNFGSQAVNLSFVPSYANGDPDHAALAVSQATLELSGNTINLTNASALTLDVGNYALIQSSNGLSITAPLTLNYVGPAMVANTTASLVVVGNTLMLQVTPAAGYAGTTFANQSPSPSLSTVYGTPTATFSGTVSAAGPAYPALGETVTVAIPNVVTNTTTIDDNTGDFTLTVPINTVPAGTYAITYSYAGNGTLAPATDTSTALIITKAAVTVTANAQNKTYGQIITFGAGSTQFTASGLQNSETIGTVTLAVSGSPAGGVSNAPVAGSPYTITPSAATGGTFSSGNYSIAYVTGLLTVNPLPVALKGTRPYDGTAIALFSILSITNAVGTDVVTLASGSVTLASSAPGSEPIASASGLTLGGAEAGDYTTAGATGAVTITVNSNPTNVVFAVSNNVMTLSWPQDHIGWTLQAQTNDVTVGLSTNWANVSGSMTTNQVTMPIDPNNGTVFYRLFYAP